MAAGTEFRPASDSLKNLPMVLPCMGANARVFGREELRKVHYERVFSEIELSCDCKRGSGKNVESLWL